MKGALRLGVLELLRCFVFRASLRVGGLLRVLGIALALGIPSAANAQPLPSVSRKTPTPVKVKNTPVWVSVCSHPVGVPETFKRWVVGPTGAAQAIPSPTDYRDLRDDAIVYIYSPYRATCLNEQPAAKATTLTKKDGPNQGLSVQRPGGSGQKAPKKAGEKKEATKAEKPKPQDAPKPASEPNAEQARKKIEEEAHEARRRRAREANKSPPPPPYDNQTSARVQEKPTQRVALRKPEQAFGAKPMAMGASSNSITVATRPRGAASGFQCRAASAPAPSTHGSGTDPATTASVRKPILDELLAYRKESEDDYKEVHRRELWILFDTIAPPMAEAFHSMLATSDIVGVTFRRALSDDPIQQELLDLLKKKYICQPPPPPPPPPAPPSEVTLPVISLTDEGAFDELHKQIIEAINDLDEGADNLTSVAMIPRKIHIKKDIIPLLHEQATKARQMAHAAFQESDSAKKTEGTAKAGDQYLGLLVALPILKLDINYDVVADWAEAANEASATLNEPLWAYRNDKDIRALLEAATASDRARMEAALPAATKRFAYYVTRLDQWARTLPKSAVLSKRVIAVVDMVFIAISIYQVVKTPVIPSGGTLPPIIGLGAGGAAVGSSLNLMSIARAAEAIRRLVAIGALDGAVIGGIGLLGGGPGLGMPELQKPSLSVAAPKGASGAPESPAARQQRYKQLEAEAQKEYPKKAGKTEQHHVKPRYLDKKPYGRTKPIDAAYHQKITNEFRQYVPYGTRPVPDDARVEEIMKEVYDKFPLPE